MYINITEALDSIDRFHERNEEIKQPKRLYDPRNYIMSMKGKKIRALLCLLGYGLYKNDIENALDISYTLELFHNFTLVHDDIMDDALVRRGVPSVHVKYDPNSAILTGDVMLIEVYDRLAKFEDGLSYIIPFNKMAREVCEGQSMDMAFEVRHDVTIAEYLKMIELKTAVLVGVSLMFGAKKAGASTKDQNHLYHFGLNAGIGFQLQDDLLDVYGDPEIFGKKVGGDIIQSKKTYLYLRAIELLAGNERSEFINTYLNVDMDPIRKVEYVTSVFNELYIKNYCEEAKQAFFGLGISHLNATRISKDKKEDLEKFSLTLLNREK